MSLKGKYVLYSVLDYALSLGGTATIIVLNFIDKDNGIGYKLSLGGVVLVIALLFYCKGVFEKNYRRKHDTLLQQLAEAIDTEAKKKISAKINELKVTNEIYSRITLLLPFIVLFIVTWLGSMALSQLQASVGLILISLGGGSVFNILKKPTYEKMQLEKIIK